jgi:NAD(P)H-dependent FMN reductase
VAAVRLWRKEPESGAAFGSASQPAACGACAVGRTATRQRPRPKALSYPRMAHAAGRRAAAAAAAANQSMRVLLFLGSTRAGRVGPRVGAWVRGQLQRRGHDVSTVDPRELASSEGSGGAQVFPMLRPHFFHAAGQAPPRLEQLAAQVQEADAYVMVTPEYNHAPSPALLETLNHFGGSSFAFKPSCIVTYSAGQWCAHLCAT